MKPTPKLVLAMLAALLLAACSSTTVDTSASPAPLAAQGSWGLLPFTNHTSEPQAALRAEAITGNLLRARGITRLQRYPVQLASDSVFDPADRGTQEKALRWAREQGLRYAVLGTVDEWGYKVGVDGEPATGFTLQVIDVQRQHVIWSAVGAKSGWSRQAVSGVAQQLLLQMLEQLPLQAGTRAE